MTHGWGNPTARAPCFPTHVIGKDDPGEFLKLRIVMYPTSIPSNFLLLTIPIIGDCYDWGGNI